MALHSGWAVEGGIGSELRLDATYISPQIDITTRMAYLCDDYDLQIMISDVMYNMFTAKVKNFLRKVDVIVTSEIKEPFGLYTFDMGEDQVEAPEGHTTGDTILLEDFTSANIDAYKHKSSDYMFTTDADINTLHKNADDISNPYREALASFFSGDWENAAEWLEQCLGVWPSDGPSKLLQNYVAEYNYTAPEEWKGYRNIDDPPPLPALQEVGEEEKIAEKPNENEAVAEETPEGKKEDKETEKKRILGAIDEHEEEELSGTAQT